MRGRYEASQDLLGALRKQLSDSEAERRGLEEQLQRLRDKSSGATQAHEDAQREAQRLRSTIDLLSRCMRGQRWGLDLMPARACKRVDCTNVVITGHVCPFKLIEHYSAPHYIIPC